MWKNTQKAQREDFYTVYYEFHLIIFSYGKYLLFFSYKSKYACESANPALSFSRSVTR